MTINDIMQTNKSNITVMESDRADLISRLFLRSLPVLTLLVAKSSINLFIDGIFAGRYIDAAAVGVIGLFYPVLMLIGALSALLAGGSSVLCGRELGRGNLPEANRIFSSSITLGLLAGSFLTLIFYLMPDRLALILGAGGHQDAYLVSYILVRSADFIPQLLTAQLMAYLQFEHQNRRSYIALFLSIISNIVFNWLFVKVLDKSVFGLALATVLSSWIFLFILASWYLSPKAQIRFRYDYVSVKKWSNIFQVGAPSMLLNICLMFRSLIMNKLMLYYVGQAGLRAQSALSMMTGLLLSVCIGAGAVTRILGSIFYGEEDRDALKQLLRTVLIKGGIITLIIGICSWLSAPFLSAAFFPDTLSEEYMLGKQVLMVNALSLPLFFLCTIWENYLQTTGHHLFANVLSIVDGLLGRVIPAVILTPLIGVMGMWISIPAGYLLTLLLIPICASIYWRRIPRGLDEMLMFEPSFGTSPDNILSLYIRNPHEVTEASEYVYRFCIDHKLKKKHALAASLFTEEMAGNVIEYGFKINRTEYVLELKVIDKTDHLLLRLIDDCPQFDPVDFIKHNQYAPPDNIGIHLVMELADKINYQYRLGLNVLNIEIIIR